MNKEKHNDEWKRNYWTTTALYFVCVWSEVDKETERKSPEEKVC